MLARGARWLSQAAFGAAATDLPLAVFARSLAELRISGSLSTLHDGPGGETQLYSSLVPFAAGPKGSPVMVLSSKGTHLTNMDGRASLLVEPVVPRTFDPSKLPLPRVNLVGALVPAPRPEQQMLWWLARHPEGKAFAAEPESTLYELQVDAINIARSDDSRESVGVFSYRNATPDYVMSHSRRLLHPDPSALKLYCVEDGKEPLRCLLYQVDTMGFSILAQYQEGWRDVRVLFAGRGASTVAEAAAMLDHEIKNGIREE